MVHSYSYHLFVILFSRYPFLTTLFQNYEIHHDVAAPWEFKACTLKGNAVSQLKPKIRYIKKHALYCTFVVALKCTYFLSDKPRTTLLSPTLARRCDAILKDCISQTHVLLRECVCFDNKICCASTSWIFSSGRVNLTAGN